MKRQVLPFLIFLVGSVLFAGDVLPVRYISPEFEIGQPFLDRVVRFRVESLPGQNQVIRGEFPVELSSHEVYRWLTLATVISESEFKFYEKKPGYQGIARISFPDNTRITILTYGEKRAVIRFDDGGAVFLSAEGLELY